MKNIPQLKISRNNSAFSTEASASQVQTKRNSDKGPHESMRISMLPVAAAVATALFASGYSGAASAADLIWTGDYEGDVVGAGNALSGFGGGVAVTSIDADSNAATGRSSSADVLIPAGATVVHAEILWLSLIHI